MEKIGKTLLLFDIYGELLTQKQQTALDLFYNEDYSLGEIATEMGVSRQAIFDSIKRGEELLAHYDEKLGMVAKIETEHKCLADLELAIKENDWQKVAAVANNLKDILA